MEVTGHPLIGQLRPVFAEISVSSGIALSSALTKLEHLIEEEGESLFHRNNAQNAQSKLLPNWVNRQLEDMAAKPEMRAAVVLCIRALANVEYMDINARTQLFCKVLEEVVVETNPVAASVDAAKAWGELVTMGGSVVESIVSVRLARCVAPVEEKKVSTSRQLATCLFLKEIITHAPALVTPSAKNVFDVIRSTVCSAAKTVRDVAAEALVELLTQMTTAPYNAAHPDRWADWVDVLLSDATKYTQTKSKEMQHGALKLFHAVLSVATARRSDLHNAASASAAAAAGALPPSAAAACTALWQFVTLHVHKESSNIAQEVRGEILAILPTMARYDSALFVQSTLPEAVVAVTTVFRSTTGPDERAPMFLLVDKLVIVLPELVPMFVDRLMTHIQNALISRPKRDRCLEAVTCFATMGAVSPKTIRPFLQRILNPLFSGLPTVEFSRDIARICVTFPELRSTCLSRMLDSIQCQLQSIANDTDNVGQLMYRNPAHNQTSNPQIQQPQQLISPKNSAVWPSSDPNSGVFHAQGGGLERRASDPMLNSPPNSRRSSRFFGGGLGSSAPGKGAAAGKGGALAVGGGGLKGEVRTQLLLTCLNVLKSLDFTGFSTLRFLSDVVVHLVRDPNEEVRRAAISLCFQLLLSGCCGPQSPCTRTEGGVMIHQGHSHMRLIVTIMHHLINAAVCDPESDIRLYTLENLTAEYDQTLASHELITAVVQALHDKQQNRLAAIKLLGRVSLRNPAYVQHMLRRVMVQCLTEIHYFSNVKTQEHAITLLGAVVEAAPSMAAPYVSALLQDAVNRLQDQTQPPAVLTALLSCIRQLVRLACEDDVEAVRAIRACVVSHILDSSSLPKKHEAIRALVEIIRATQDVAVYEEFPQLIGVLLSALHGGFKETWPVRQDVLQLLGVIGAVDPLKVKESARDMRDRSNTDRKSVSYYRNRGEDAVAQTVLAEVLEALKLPSMQDEQCVRALEALVNVCGCRDITTSVLVSVCPSTVTTFLQQLRTHPKVRDRLLAQLTLFIGIAKQHIRPHMSAIVDTLCGFLTVVDHEVLAQALALCLELRRTLHEEFKPYISSILPPLVAGMDSRHPENCVRTMEFFSSLGRMLEDHLHNVLPSVVDVAGSQTFSVTCRVVAINTLVTFAQQMTAFSQHAARCVHCLCRLLRESASAFAPATTNRAQSVSHDVEKIGVAAWSALVLIGQYLGSDFEKFLPIVIPVIASVFGEESSRFKQFASVVGEAVRSRSRPHAMTTSSSAYKTAGADDAGGGGGGVGSPSGAGGRGQSSSGARGKGIGDYGMEALRVALVGRERHTEEDWKQWLRQFAVELLRASPSVPHGLAYPLAQVHEPFAWHMFHSAFAACYGEMNDTLKREVTAQLTAALRNTRIPSEMLQELLNLAEYMERLETRYIPPSAPTSKGTASSSSYLSAISLFDLETLMSSSERCNLYSKALHYVEIQFFETTREFELSKVRGVPKPLPEREWKALMDLCEKSIYFYNLLGQRESAEGILKYFQHNFSLLTGQPEEQLLRSIDAQWFDKLQWWTQSYRAYEKQLRAEPNKVSNMTGLMRALDSLGDYARLLAAWKRFNVQVSRKDAGELAPMGAHAAWLMQSWDDMGAVTSQMTSKSYTGTTAVFYKAVLATYRRQFHDAEKYIVECRKRLDSSLSALVAESYDRAYALFVGIQQLSELEEIADVLRHPERITKWQTLWEKRLSGMAYEGWPGTLANHTLVLDPTKELNMWIRFVTLSRMNGRDRVSDDVLHKLLGDRSVEDSLREYSTLPEPAVANAAFQHIYESDNHDRATDLLSKYVTMIESVLQNGGDDWARAGEVNGGSGALASTDKFNENLAVCHAKLGEWLAQRPHVDYLTDTAAQEEVLLHLRRATVLDPSSGWIWHTWARVNHDIVTKGLQLRTLPSRVSFKQPEPAQPAQAQSSLERSYPSESKGAHDSISFAAGSGTSHGSVPGMGDGYVTATEHIISCAIDGYLRSAYLSGDLQDALGFLSLWFTYGANESIQRNTTIKSSIQRVSATVWLKVIPQIVARMYTPNATVMESVYQLLVLIAKTHPQGLLYPLHVGNMSTSTATEAIERKAAGQRVLNKIAELHHNGQTLVNEAAMVCTELVRCAVLWTELWFDELERAWFLWGKEKDAHVVLVTLQPLLAQLRRPETMAESHFVAEFGATLTSACALVEKAATLGKEGYMDEAWNVFKNAVERMDQQINSMSSLEMQLISPRLLQSGKNLSVAIPGQYRENGSFPRIHSFQSTLHVMSSKQHPRRIFMNGSDGATYKFLLKGHEDLRLDERVMQLLGLVNTLLESHSTTKRQDCLIQAYSVTPLSDNAGLVGWVDNCNTLHQLIKEYRVHSKYLSTERNLMRSVYDDLGRLTVIQHVEPFEYALENTEGTDLARSLWVRAPSAEMWLDRRTSYVCSLATMSMVGHILGLGDRHPSNLMIHAFSGRVVHIDFGDCFEAAQERSSYPEKVPFRLTRMLVKAMEMGGIEGFFRHCSITVMHVLREESSSLLAMLEAFVHDPLVSWWRDTEEDNDGTVDENDEAQEPEATEQGGRTRARAVPVQGNARDESDIGGMGTYASMAESFKRLPREVDVGSVYDNEKVARSVRRTRKGGRQPPGTKVYASSHRNKIQAERQTKKAQRVLNRIKEKLDGREFTLGLTDIEKRDGLTVKEQVSRLIIEATSSENLCVHFEGWCPFW